MRLNKKLVPLEAPLWFWTLGFRLVIYAELNASEFMNEGLTTDQLGVQNLGNGVGEIWQRGPGCRLTEFTGGL